MLEDAPRPAGRPDPAAAFAKQAAAIGTRWFPELRPDVAEVAMECNIQQVDRPHLGDQLSRAVSR